MLVFLVSLRGRIASLEDVGGRVFFVEGEVGGWVRPWLGALAFFGFDGGKNPGEKNEDDNREAAPKDDLNNPVGPVEEKGEGRENEDPDTKCGKKPRSH